MAVSNNFLERIEDITECPICCETFREPRVLPCIHTFCLTCLKEYGKDKNPGDGIACPVCRLVSTLPKTGFAGFPKNFFIDKLLEARNASDRRDSTKCDVCMCSRKMDGTGGEVNIASKYCAECQENMCDPCSQKHLSMKISKLHRMFPLGSLPDELQWKKLSKVACDQHAGEELKIYCWNCKQVGCLMCFVQLHQSHKCTDVNQVFDRMKDEIKNDLKDIDQLMLKVGRQFEELKTEQEQYLEKTDKMEKEIKKRGEEIKHLVDEHTDGLIKQLTSKKSQKLKAIETVRGELETQKIRLESFKRYSRVIVDQGVPVEVARCANDLKEKAKDLKNQPAIEIEKHADFVFKPADLSKFETEDSISNAEYTENIVGIITGK